jgi:hypothetical protein
MFYCVLITRTLKWSRISHTTGIHISSLLDNYCLQQRILTLNSKNPKYFQHWAHLNASFLKHAQHNTLSYVIEYFNVLMFFNEHI